MLIGVNDIIIKTNKKRDDMKKRLTEEKRITDFFAQDVFTDSVMREYMSSEDYEALRDVIESGGELEISLADKVADAMKDWALTKGATHYTHWFQPLTGTTAEKHDSFVSVDTDGNTILEFRGKNLCRGEADASSFPSGGIRATFEARGYTVWDVNSPAFIKKSMDGAGVLCIPTAFCSYTGDALDKKTPLLRSMTVLDREGRRLLKLLGIEAKRVIPNVGGEQEYFLVDKAMYAKRDDLKFTGRTLFGAPAPKGQEKNDQYYANIKERVLCFMADLNEELWKLGITAKTQHNETAPSQHELAPIYNSANIATDQNQLIMEMLKKVANRHDLTCLLHEKPFKCVNGSGKHNNWSLMTDDGMNLFEPGNTPESNRVFLLFILALIGGIDEYQDLVRMSAASAGNDLRIGANEAPPAIISVYIGDRLETMFENLENGAQGIKRIKEYLKTGIPGGPKLKKDDSDRNRTSPIAFTGNKFEFRMVGSSQTLATANIVLNIITAEMLRRISDEIEYAVKNDLNSDFDHIISTIVLKYIKKHRHIIFNGNNYTEEWKNEAESRGLKNLANCPDALKSLLRPEVVTLFETNGVLTEKELKSRYEIYMSEYSKTVHIEALTALSIVKTQILPAVMLYEGDLAKAHKNIVKAGSAAKTHADNIAKLDKLIDELSAKIDYLEDVTAEAAKIQDVRLEAEFSRDKILPSLSDVRETVDAIQLICDRRVWPYPNYADLLFYE